MKILLFALNGSYTHTSLAIRCLRTPLEREGFLVELLERNLRDRTAHILHDLVTSDADIISFSAYIWNIRPMLELARDLKTIRPTCKIVFGGPEVSYDCERFTDQKFIDAIVCGEGEAALPALCHAFQDGKPASRIWHAMPSHEDRKSTRLNSSHYSLSRMPSSA